MFDEGVSGSDPFVRWIDEEDASVSTHKAWTIPENIVRVAVLRQNFLRRINRMNLLTVSLVFIFTFASSVAMAQSDAAGCKDVPLFNRMPNHYIASCQDSPFEARKFPVGPIAPNG